MQAFKTTIVMSGPTAPTVQLASTLLVAQLVAVHVPQALPMSIASRRHHVYRARLVSLRVKATLGPALRAQQASAQVLWQLSARTARLAHLIMTHKLTQRV